MISSWVLTECLLRQTCGSVGGKPTPPPWGLLTSLIWYQCWPRKGSVSSGKPERKVFLLTGQALGTRFLEATGSSSPWRKCVTLGVKNVTLQITAGRKLPLGLHLLGHVILGHSAMQDSSSSWVTWGKARFSLHLLPGGLGRNHAKAGSSDFLSCQVCPRKSQAGVSPGKRSVHHWRAIVGLKPQRHIAHYQGLALEDSAVSVNGCRAG